MEENWKEIYELADTVADRHIRDGAKGQFCEPVVQRLRRSATTFDEGWQAKCLNTV